ncbi:TetR/AcrR family transcriptional regulator [Actinomadura opuntiae]|uniref:TetR/AcrR family transcriptional regulator n=1 Tax=Actinomadura sp. OS1-43 TaxID=604315 RepID=UPI00255AC446|nr:TetR/AcrR family transcriptional regulator [Actinomadura sp. OS1-43]MDL4816477.1 TetR/AcrR family transcriptional regulator [Actinomadura sp. OS1-43]
MRRTQEDRTRATRAALVTAARKLFAERGYAAVSAEQIVAAAGVTRGALQHHFGDKKALFAAVLDQMEVELSERIFVPTDDPWELLTGGLARFLDACEEPELVQIALRDAPAVLGWQAWREIEARHNLALIEAGLNLAMDAGVLSRRPVRTVAHLLLSACIEAALLIAAGNPRRETEETLLTLLDGLRAPAPPGGDGR